MQNIYQSQNHPTIILTPKHYIPNRRHSTNVYFTHRQSPTTKYINITPHHASININNTCVTSFPVHNIKTASKNQRRSYLHMNLNLNNHFLVNKSATSAKQQPGSDRSYQNINTVRRYSIKMSSPKSNKIVRQNVLKPCNKPINKIANKIVLQNNMSFNNIQSPQFIDNVELPTKINIAKDQIINNNKNQLNHHHIDNQHKDLPETLQIINQRLKQLKLSQSIDPIVQPYRDRSTDSYHSLGYHYNPNINDKIKDYILQNTNKQYFFTRPTASQDYNHYYQQNYTNIATNQQIAEPTTPNFIPLPLPNNKINQYTHTYPYPYNSIYPQKSKQLQNTIKQDIQQQKQSKQLYKNNTQKYNKQKQINEQIYDKDISFNSIKQTHQLNQQYYKFLKQDNKQHQNQCILQSQAQKCAKIVQIYSPYSMNLTSNNQSLMKKQQTQNQPQSLSPIPTSKNPQINRLHLSKVDKLRYNKILQNKTKQQQYFEDEDKWDKILRERQQVFKKSISGEQQEDQLDKLAKLQLQLQEITAANTAIKNNSNNNVNNDSDSHHLLSQLHHYSAASYQSSQANKNNGQNSQIQYSQLALSGPGIHLPTFSSPSPQQQYRYGNQSQNQLLQKISQTNSNDNFYHKIQQISNQYSNNNNNNQNIQTNKYKTSEEQNSRTPKIYVPNQMKYSYNFQQNKQIQYLKQKQLFSKLLQSNEIQWMLIFNQMIQYVQNKYINNNIRGNLQHGNNNNNMYKNRNLQNLQNNNNNNQPGQLNRNQMLVTFVKIGNDGDTIYQNRIIAHYVGIWLLSMGYGNNQIRQRVVSNVQLMFTDINQIIQKDNQQKYHQQFKSKSIDKYESQQQQYQNQQQQQKQKQEQQQCSIAQIAQIMYNNLLYGYLPGDLQLRALLEICKRGWQYMTFLICKILRLLIKIHKNRKNDKNHQIKFMYSNIENVHSFISQQMLYKKLQSIINNN